MSTGFELKVYFYSVADITLQYPLWWRCNWPIVEDGWQAFSLQMEFSRLQVQSPNWRLSRINEGYQICSTYPELAIVPAAVDDEIIKESAKFRQGSRFPVLSYFHKPTKVF